jgi:fluoride exporter
MTAGTMLLVAVAGGVGASLRFALDGWITGRRRSALPLGTLIINVSGSLFLGLVTGAAAHLGADVVAILGTGLLGGYTTFSTASVETVRLARAGRTGVAAMNGLGMLVVAVAAAVVGLLLGGLV